MISPVPGGLIAAPRRWDFLAGLMLEQGYKTFVEVGCKEGRTTGHILKTVPDSRVIAIDPWMAQEATADPTKETYKEWNFQEIEEKFWDNVCTCQWDKMAHKVECPVNHKRGGGHRLAMLRMTSEEAAKSPAFAPPAAIDLIFIDALHDYEHVMQDISLWWPHVRKGGILAGHDFNHKWPGVERAVADQFNLMDVGVGYDSVWFVVKS